MNWPEWLLAATTVFLVFFFAVAEIQQRKKSIPATFQGLLPEEVPGGGFLARTALVDLEDGRRVKAVLAGCVLCQSRFRRGDRLHVRKWNDAYHVTGPAAARDACPDGGGR